MSEISVDLLRVAMKDGTTPMNVSVKVFDEEHRVIHAGDIQTPLMLFLKDRVIPSWLTLEELQDLSNCVLLELELRGK